MKNYQTILKKTIERNLTPPKQQALSDWANENRFIGVGAGPLPGPYRWQVAPYQKGMMDVANDPSIERVVFCCSVQSGKTSVIENIIAYYMAANPCPMMLVLPNQRDAEIFSTTRLDGMIKDTPILQGLIKSKSTKDSGDTRLQKRFYGGSIELVSAKSDSAFRGRSIRVMLMDEIDAYEMGIEGDVIGRAEKRTQNYFNRKIILTSTPTDITVSQIWPQFLNGDRRFYYVKCPQCGVSQQLVFSQLKFPNKSPEFVYYECANNQCAYQIQEVEKHQMLLDGFWQATEPDNTYPSFHLNALYSPWKSWKEIAREWIASEDDISKRKVFINTVLAEPWRDDKPETTIDELQKNCVVYDAPVPSGVGVLLMGVDVQKERLEAYVWGCGIGENWYLIDEHYIYSDPSNDATWQELFSYINKTYTTSNGKQMPLSLCAIDTGYASELVYRFVKNCHNNRIIAVRGSTTSQSRLISKPYYSKDKTPFYYVGTETAKDSIYAGFRSSGATRRYYFPAISPLHPQGTAREIFEQLLSEKKITKYKNNTPYFQWTKLTQSTRNEALDCLVYCMAGLAHLNCYNQLEIEARKYMKDGGEVDLPVSSSFLLAPIQPPQPRTMPKIVYKPKYYGQNGW